MPQAGRGPQERFTLSSDPVTCLTWWAWSSWSVRGEWLLPRDGAVEKEGACGVGQLLCKDRVMLGWWSSRRNQVSYGWKACTHQLFCSVCLIYLKATVQSGHYKNKLRKCPLFIPSLGLVSASFVCMSVSAEFVFLEDMI